MCIGINLVGLVDWGSEWLFVDIMKYGCIWIIYNVYWVDGGVNDWDIDVFIYIFLDEYGYLLLLLVVDIFGMEVL